MPEGYFTPWQVDLERECRTCRHSIGTPDGWHLWGEPHRLVVVFPCGWRDAGGECDAGCAWPAPRGDRPAVTNAIPSAACQKNGRYLRRVRCALMKIETRRRTVSRVKASDWKRLAKRGWQLALLLIVPGGSIIVLALWWLELSREVPFEVHP